MTVRHTLEVKYDSSTGDHYLEFTPDMLAQMGWDYGDTIVWKDNNDGSWTLSKKVDNEAGVTKEDGSANGADQNPTSGDS